VKFKTEECISECVVFPLCICLYMHSHCTKSDISLLPYLYYDGVVHQRPSTMVVKFIVFKFTLESVHIDHLNCTRSVSQILFY
jgi:hypothetical protein